MISIIIPTYNEKNNLQPLINRISDALKNTSFEIIFVDDSTDDTAQALAELARDYKQITAYHRDCERGLASAVVFGFSQAQGEVIAVMDADLQHPPELLPAMLRAIEHGADIVLPSRYIHGGYDGGLSPFRKLVSTSAKLIGKVLLSPLRNISDPTGGYFMFRRGVISGKALRPTGWKILIEVLVIGEYKSVVEIPYAFDKRNADSSKMGTKVTLQYLRHIFSLVIRSGRECRRKR